MDIYLLWRENMKTKYIYLIVLICCGIVNALIFSLLGNFYLIWFINGIAVYSFVNLMIEEFKTW